MQILFDTHALIWFLEDSSRLPQHVRSVLLDPGSELFFSPVSILEISIKHALKVGFGNNGELVRGGYARRICNILEDNDGEKEI